MLEKATGGGNSAEQPFVTRLRILAPTRYVWTFNGPRHSRHIVERRNFLPLNRISQRIEAATIINPWPPRRFDLIHGMNRIPLNPGPFIIGFESHMPRAYGLEKTSYFRQLSRVLAGPRCRGIVAISEHAHRIFRYTHEESPYRDELFSKLSMHLPNIEIPEGDDPLPESNEPLRIAFVGNHFGRKGGCVAVRLAQLALARKFPLVVEIASSLQVGGTIWTDPVSRSFFDPYVALLKLPNVRWHGGLDNRSVNELLRRSHLSLLTTFGDTFGFSALESIANWTPVIATAQGALPEFIVHRHNGILLHLPVSELGEWIHISSPLRSTRRFENIFADEVERLAREAFAEIERLVAEPQRLRTMRRRARETAIRMFDSHAASEYWDEQYVAALAVSRSGAVAHSRV
jgi:glycosyltransferase involved in cell wall biosynthesis